MTVAKALHRSQSTSTFFSPNAFRMIRPGIERSSWCPHESTTLLGLLASHSLSHSPRRCAPGPTNGVPPGTSVKAPGGRMSLMGCSAHDDTGVPFLYPEPSCTVGLVVHGHGELSTALDRREVHAPAAHRTSVLLADPLRASPGHHRVSPADVDLEVFHRLKSAAGFDVLDIGDFDPRADVDSVHCLAQLVGLVDGIPCQVPTFEDVPDERLVFAVVRVDALFTEVHADEDVPERVEDDGGWGLLHCRLPLPVIRSSRHQILWSCGRHLFGGVRTGWCFRTCHNRRLPFKERVYYNSLQSIP